MKSFATAVLLTSIVAPLAAQTPSPAPAPAPAAAPRQQLPADSLAIARKYLGWLWSSQADSIQNHVRQEDRTAENRQQFLDMVAQIAARAGTETQLIEERWVRRNGNRQYWRIARFSDFTDEPLVVRIVILPNGNWGGLGVGPLSQVPPVDPEP